MNWRDKTIRVFLLLQTTFKEENCKTSIIIILKIVVDAVAGDRRDFSLKLGSFPFVIVYIVLYACMHKFYVFNNAHGRALTANILICIPNSVSQRHFEIYIYI